MHLYQGKSNPEISEIKLTSQIGLVEVNGNFIAWHLASQKFCSSHFCKFKGQPVNLTG